MLKSSVKEGNSEGEPKKKKKTCSFSVPEEEKPKSLLSSVSNQRGRRVSSTGGNNGSKPEWYQDLNLDQISMFKEVFVMLDRDGGGSIDAEELFTVMKDLDIAITLDEIKDVLQGLDSDGNGEIDFDEFLYAMSETDKYLDSLADGGDKADAVKYSKRQSLFFTAITKFAMKNSLGEIERYYAAKARKVPHVISHYTAGARLDGLNDKQLASAMRRMQKDAKKYDSPYAKPLPFVMLHNKKPKSKTTKKTDVPEIDVKVEPPIPTRSEEDISPETSYQHLLNARRASCRRGAWIVNPQDMQLMNTLKEMANKGSIIAKLPNVHLVPQIRAKLESGEVDDLCTGRRKKQNGTGESGDSGLDTDEQAPITDVKEKLVGNVPLKHGWRSPKISSGRALLPIIHLGLPKGKSTEVTIEDVPLIRKKVSYSLDQYYATLKQSHVETAWSHWSRLYTNEIRSKRLLDNFRKVFRAYSPHKEQDVFVICPWIPGRVPQHHRYASSSRNSIATENGRRAITPNSLRSSTPSSGSSSSTSSPVPRSKSANSYY